MTPYREILRLASLGLSQQNISESCNSSKRTVNRIINRAKEINLSWPFDDNVTDKSLHEKLFPQKSRQYSTKKLPDFDYIRKEILKNGVNKTLLWAEYVKECQQSKQEPLMYSQFCHYIRIEEQKRRATMHIDRKPGEQVEVDWAGDPIKIVDPDTEECFNAWLFVGVLSYSQYPYVEAFLDQKQQSWITAHVHMFEYYGGVPKILVPDNCKTAVIHNNNWYDLKINKIYHNMAEHYNTAIIPTRVRSPQDKPNAEGTVKSINTWITASLRNEQFFSLNELNQTIKTKLKEFSEKSFQKKEGSRFLLFEEEKPFLSPLPLTRYEITEWHTATVQYNYHVSVDGMFYSVPFEYIRNEVDIKSTNSFIEIFYKNQRIASHPRLKGRKGQYSTIIDHMPEDHREYLTWNGDKFRNKAKEIGESTAKVINTLLNNYKNEKEAYRSCMSILKLAGRYSEKKLEVACSKALQVTLNPSYKTIKGIISNKSIETEQNVQENLKSIEENDDHAITRGADYYKG